jgi:hypothetical protein
MKYVEPQVLPALSAEQLAALIDCFENNSQMQILPMRRFALDIAPAIEVVRPIIDSVLGVGTWRVTGGNYFETETGYRVHADTGKEGPHQVWQTFVFPLRHELRTDIPVRLERNRLLILNQTWDKDAAFFLRGETVEPNEYNQVITNYKDVGNLDSEDSIDGILLDYCPHLNVSNFAGLSVDKHFQWIPGVPMTFPRNRLHVSSAFPRNGIKRKLGLSLFISPQDQ